MQIVRTFWGEMNHTYTLQIIDSINLNEIVYVWGKDNYDFIISKGFRCILVSDQPYDYTISKAHHLHDYRNMHHKLVCIDMATKEFGEILFLDWDCKLIKVLDDNFYNRIRSGNSIQVPLYMYPKESLDSLIDNNTDEVMTKFFSNLRKNIKKYSYDWNGCYVLPNTGFVYCRDSSLTSHLCDLSNKLELEILVEEFALYIYTSSMYSLEEYIQKIEPSFISGKSNGHGIIQGDEEFCTMSNIWNNYQNKFNEYVSSIKEKDIYFLHD